ncbi:MAG TPA: xanthine dehydrogenase family protein subunit M [Gemmatimonadaceae bacterium]|nr:xanthine dehydrogenase family protein subunit M [Gemmatimonadaceae bacterium]
MNDFDYTLATDLDHAADLLGRMGSAPIGGGTDLLVAIGEGIIRPEHLVDLRGIPGARGLEWRDDGSLRIGAVTRIAHLAADPAVNDRLPALAMACAAVGSPALRNMGTLGGNLCQRPRCWYFRGGLPCLKAGGAECFALHGENQHHAILGGGPCYIVHPSDPAVALMALDATVVVRGGAGERRLGIEEFFVLPEQRLDSEIALAPGEFVQGVEIPAASMSGRQRYVKLMQRGAWDFALASLAAVRRTDGTVRLVLGGVAPIPWRVNPSVEEDASSGALEEADFEALASRALHDARPLSGNAYKVSLAESLLRDGLRFVSSAGSP